MIDLIPPRNQKRIHIVVRDAICAIVTKGLTEPDIKTYILIKILDMQISDCALPIYEINYKVRRVLSLIVKKIRDWREPIFTIN